jgi:CRP/FNR family transcriptional regulator, cyclic AMP receptor protein
VHDSHDIRAEALKRAAVFSGLATQELNYVVQRSVLKTYPAGAAIFSEGEACSGLYIVQQGTIKIFKVSSNGREQVLSIDGPGSSVAELPVFDGGAYPASATAMTDAALVFVSRHDFRSLCLEYPEVALKVLRVVGGRLRRLVGIIEELSFSTVAHRLASLLLDLAHRTGRTTPSGVEFNLPATNQELAAMIGTVRELVSRNMSRLQAAGILTIDGRRIVVHDLERLETETRPD